MKSRRHLFLWTLWILPVLGLAPIIPAIGSLGTSSSPALTGAWEAVEIDGQPVAESMPNTLTIAIYASNYLMVSTYDTEKPAFMVSGGGAYEYGEDKLSFTMEFHTKDPESVGKVFAYEVAFDGEDKVTFTMIDGEKKTTNSWKRIDKGDASLTGAWRIRERLGRDGQMHQMRPGPRKTIKILSATRFQWTAMNTETKQFFGTGGGTYTFKNGEYTENIEFFSRDSSRVGATLSFQGKVEGDDWHHSGKSSRGNPIKEIWQR